MKKGQQKISGEIAELKTKAGEVLIIVPEGQSLEAWMVSGENPKSNENVKYHSSGKAQLGLPRMF